MDSLGLHQYVKEENNHTPLIGKDYSSLCSACVVSVDGLPFRYNENTTGVSVVQRLDREERERYELIAKCTVREGSKEMQVEVPFLVNVLDEDDSAPFLPNGTSTTDAVVEFNRKEVEFSSAWTLRCSVEMLWVRHVYMETSDLVC